jgi:predicted DNA-binding transcriptional regulator AlpA
MVTVPTAETANKFKIVFEREAHEMLHIGRSTFLEGVRVGRYPPPIYFSKRKRAWRLASLQAFLDGLAEGVK